MHPTMLIQPFSGGLQIAPMSYSLYLLTLLFHLVQYLTPVAEVCSCRCHTMSTTQSQFLPLIVRETPQLYYISNTKVNNSLACLTLGSCSAWCTNKSNIGRREV